MRLNLFLQLITMLKRILLLLLLTYSFAAMAQTKQIKGVVISAEDKQPLTGASVSVKGSNKGSITDQNGAFQLQIAENDKTLIVSFVGFVTKEVPVTGSSLSIILNPDSRTIDEVVVVAYGTANKSSFTGSVAQIKKDQIEKLQVGSVSKALQGLAPGVQSVSASGQPGTDATIRIRGIGSIYASSEPLYVVDGIPFSGNINSINPTDIESISVLKDASSSALYGSRGANGVVIITTKQGSRNKDANIQVNLQQGISNRAVDDYKHVSTDQYFQLYWEALRNKEVNQGATRDAAAATASQRVVEDLGINPYGAAYPNPVGLDGRIVSGAKPLWNDDWQKAMEQTARRTQADLSVSGGGDNSQYFVSGGYLNDKGIALASGFERVNARSNFTINAKKWLKLGLNLAGSTSKQDYPQSEDSQVSNVANFGRNIPSFYPIYERNEDGSYKLDLSGNKVVDYGAYRPSAVNPRTNLIGTAYLDKSQIQKDDISLRSFFEASILSNLKLKTSYSVDYSGRNDVYYSNPSFGESAEIKGSVQRDNYRTFSWTLNNVLTYDKLIGTQHHINLLAGQELYNYNWRYTSGSRQGFVLPGLEEPDAASQLNDFSGYSNNYKLLSFFGKAEYDYQQKYYFSGSLRADGTSRFSPQSRWGTFWSLGASWKAKQESFLESISWLDVLTLKASYGAQGNDNLGYYYAYEGLYTVANNLGEGGAYTLRLATPNLKWETNLNLNLGVDFSVLNNRLGGTFEYFQRKSKDLLYPRPLPISSGFSSIDENVGQLKNNGFELSVNATPLIVNNFKWNVNFNLTHYKNEITELPQKEIISGTKKLMVGRSIYDFYIREWAGVDEATGKPQWFKDDANGNKVKTFNYSEGTQYYVGSSLPDFYGGLTNSFSYKGFELSALLVYSAGGKVLDNDIVSLLHNGNNPGRAWNEEILNRWTPENTITDVPALTTDNTNWTQTSTRFLYDASYLRLKNVTLNYNFPANTAKKIGLNNLRVYVQADNLLTWSKHKGMDPEQTVGGTTYYRYPAMKVFSAGVNVNF